MAGKKPLRILLFVVGFLGFLGNGCSDGAVEQRSLILKEECIVYRTLIDELYPSELIVILGETVPSNSGRSSEEEFLQKNLGDLIEEDTFTNYQTNNRNPHDFDPDNCLGLEYVRLTDDERRQIFERGDGWSQLEVQHPGASRVLMTFSKVGFNSNRSQALTFVQSFGDFGAGNGLYVLFAKSDGIWSIQRKIPAWVS